MMSDARREALQHSPLVAAQEAHGVMERRILLKHNSLRPLVLVVLSTSTDVTRTRRAWQTSTEDCEAGELLVTDISRSARPPATAPRSERNMFQCTVYTRPRVIHQRSSSSSSNRSKRVRLPRPAHLTVTRGGARRPAPAPDPAPDPAPVRATSTVAPGGSRPTAEGDVGAIGAVSPPVAGLAAVSMPNGSEAAPAATKRSSRLKLAK